MLIPPWTVCQSLSRSPTEGRTAECAGELERGFAFGAGTVSIEGTYLSGVSITHGMGPRQHIWSYAIGLTDDSATAQLVCPECHSYGNPSLIPAFVGADYFCESGINEPMQAVTTVSSSQTIFSGTRAVPGSQQPML